MPPLTIPYVVGNWVRGERFYGRDELIAEVLGGHRRSLWLVGTRRSGKTSVLKQLEYLTDEAVHPRYFAVFWDFQGAEDHDGLRESWSDALLDAEDRLERLGIDPEELQTDDLFESMRRLRRALRVADLRLLALCDEVEELIRLQHAEPKLVRSLRRALQSSEDVHCVLASSIRLWALSETREDTSPFLHGFTPPFYLPRLSDDSARALVRQDKLAPEARPALPEGVVDEILSRCDNHPFLLQLLAKRVVECGNLDEACEEVASDRMVSHFFAVDVDMLEDDERRILAVIAAHSAASSHSLVDQLAQEGVESDLSRSLLRLENLGYIRRGRERKCVLASYFFRRWVEEIRVKADSSAREIERVQEATAEMPSTPSFASLSGDRSIEGRYSIIEQIGVGAHGVVYRARDDLLGAQIAIKMLKPELVGDERLLERLRKEVLLSRDLSHPNILRVYHLGGYQGRVFLTMQWVDGPTLKEVIRERAPLPAAEVTRVGALLASALEAAHGHNVLHRDLKPENVLMRHGVEPLIADFGLARLIGEPGVTRADMFVGTPKYASPEQASAAPLDARSDLYGLGLILFEMATGHAPFRAETAVGILVRHTQEPAPDPRSIVPGVPEELALIILRCLEKRPEDRFPDCGALREALLAAGKKL